MFQQGGSSHGQGDGYLDAVAINFVEEYYTRLAGQPESVAVFYHPHDSAFSRLEPDQASQEENNVIGQSGIREAILAQGYQNCRVKINHVDCQSSVDGCIIVMITGIMMVKTQLRNFAQTFVLGRQGPVEAPSYYLRNDILRFLNTVDVTPHSGAETPSSRATPQPAPEASPQPEPEVVNSSANEESEEAPAAAASAAELSEEPAEQEREATPEPPEVKEPVPQQATEAAIPDEKQAGKRERRPRREKKESKGGVKKPEAAPAAAAAKGSEPAAPAAAPVPAAPVSWASRLGSKHIVAPPVSESAAEVQDTDESAATPEAAAPAAAEAAAGAPADQKQANIGPAKPRAPKQTKAKLPAGGKPMNGHTDSVVDDSCSLYVKNVPPTAKDALIEIFSSFGTCTLEFLPHKTYGFVHFETAANATAALDGRPLELDGQQLVIDRKKPPRSNNPKFADRGDGGGAFFERGAGGFRGDSRGRGRFRPRRGRGGGRGGAGLQGDNKGGSK